MSKLDVEKDFMGAKYMKMEQSVCFLDNAMYVVEVLVSEHNIVEVKEAKLKEIQNLKDYDTFEQVEEVGQECKEKHDGQKTEFKARLVARGCQEKDKP